MATKKKFSLEEEDMVGLISGAAVELPKAPAQAVPAQAVPVQDAAAPAPETIEKPRRTLDPRVTFGVSLKGSMKHKIDMCTVVKRTNASQIVADALNEYFERHADVLEKYEKMEQLGLLD